MSNTPKTVLPSSPICANIGVYTVLRVPLVAADTVIGYFSLWETRAPRGTEPKDLRFVQTLASQAAAALVNAQLPIKRNKHATCELQALHEASRLINSTLDVRAICEHSVNSLRDNLEYQHVSIYFIENDRLRLQVQRGYETVLDDIRLTSGIIARAVQTRGNCLFGGCEFRAGVFGSAAGRSI